MFSAEAVASIHQQLQSLTPRNTVLLGGSYLFDEANEASDLDFCVLVNIWQFLWYKKFKNIFADFKQKFSNANIMLVPCWRGEPIKVYYVNGVDVNGKRHLFATRDFIIRNALKLSYFNYIRFLAVPKNKVRNLQKAFKQIATAAIFSKLDTVAGAPFTWRYIAEHKNLLDEEFNRVATECQKITPMTSAASIAAVGREVYQIIKRNQETLASDWHFSWSHYAFYNAVLLSRGKGSFLFYDPDKMVLKKMAGGLETGADPVRLYEEMRKIVFPVVIF